MLSLPSSRNRRGTWVGARALMVAGAICLAGATSWAQIAPKLVSSVPASNATDVAVASRTVTFVFDLAMLPNDALDGVPGFFQGAIRWSDNLADGFQYEWSGADKFLTCTYNSDFPANATITWALNPTDVFDGLHLQSAAGVSLPKGVYSGSFQTGAASGGGDPGGEVGEVPKLVSTTPAHGATAVPVSSKVIFVFDQPMVPNPQVGGVPPFLKGPLAWTGTGLNATKFTYSWSADNKTLTCTYTGSLPGTTTIGWTLNPADAAFTMDSQEGEPLPTGLYQGSFTTGEGGTTDPGDCDDDEFPDTWGNYSLYKSATYVQASTADPVPDDGKPFLFGGIVTSGQAGPMVTAASLTVPGQAAKTLTGFAGAFFISNDYATEAALDTAYPAGGYALKFTRSGESERTVNMTFPANTIPIPKVANHTEAQAVNQAQPFTLRWNGFAGGTAPNDFQSLSIYEADKLVFQAPDRCVPRDLAVNATSIVIPAGTLQAGRTYSGHLSYSRQVYFSTNAVPEMSGFGSFSRITEFTLVTTGGVVAPAAARFVEYRLLPNGSRELVLTGTANRAYTVQRAGGLGSPAWESAGVVTMDATGRATLMDSQVAALPVFYRAVAN